MKPLNIDDCLVKDFENLVYEVARLINDDDKTLLENITGITLCRCDESLTIEGVAPEVDDWLEKFGYSYLGKGCFSIALLHINSNKVLKLNLSNDDEGVKYWVFCMDNSDVKYLPKTHMVDSTGGIRWCVQDLYTIDYNRNAVLRRNYNYDSDYLAYELFPEVYKWANDNNFRIDLNSGNIAECPISKEIIALDPVSYSIKRDSSIV